MEAGVFFTTKLREIFIYVYIYIFIHCNIYTYLCEYIYIYIYIFLIFMWIYIYICILGMPVWGCGPGFCFQDRNPGRSQNLLISILLKFGWNVRHVFFFGRFCRFAAFAKNNEKTQILRFGPVSKLLHYRDSWLMTNLRNLEVFGTYPSEHLQYQHIPEWFRFGNWIVIHDMMVWV